MDGLHHLEIVILLLAVVLLLTTLAEKLVIPYPILLVIGGLILGLIPGIPTVTLSPDLVFLVFLPPILSAAAYFTSWREFKQNLRPISWLAVGLVVVTTAVVAIVTRAVLPGLGWAEAIALGAIVSPPDAVSATAIGKRLRIPPPRGDDSGRRKLGERCDRAGVVSRGRRGRDRREFRAGRRAAALCVRRCRGGGDWDRCWTGLALGGSRGNRQFHGGRHYAGYALCGVGVGRSDACFVGAGLCGRRIVCAAAF
ncbi:membrane hypothetical protein [Nitrospira lenta]|uniref:Cation/H+ exchanger transmembrane domain-containing protein n=1 Tax=Nitrospira lenta TaxID=1436998 RepID=A0A330L5S9_9BACT|nr:membrane hypothetical protein [Nitrospira lenta]